MSCAASNSAESTGLVPLTSQQTAGEAESVIYNILVSRPVRIAIFCREILASILRYESRFSPSPGWSDPDSSGLRH